MSQAKDMMMTTPDVGARDEDERTVSLTTDMMMMMASDLGACGRDK